MKQELVVLVTMILGVALGYNLICCRKQGWGWIALCAIASVIAFIGKVAIAMFCEVSADNEISDWDE